MPKYQIGDRVWNVLKVGGVDVRTFGTVTENERNSEFAYKVKFDNRVNGLAVYESEIELIEEVKVSGYKFSVGDKVVRKTHHLGGSFVEGKVYTVERVESRYDIRLEGVSGYWDATYFDKYVPTTLKDAKVGDTVRVVIEGKVTRVNATTVGIDTPPFGDRDYDAKREAEIIDKAKPFAEKPGTVFKHTIAGDMYIRRDDGKVTSLTSGYTFDNTSFNVFAGYEIVYTPE